MIRSSIPSFTASAAIARTERVSEFRCFCIGALIAVAILVVLVSVSDKAMVKLTYLERHTATVALMLICGCVSVAIGGKRS
jgi:hypothetical protein